MVLATASNVSRVAPKIAPELARERGQAWGWSCFGGCFVGPTAELEKLGVTVEEDFTNG